ncbi:MAG: NAD(P)/FAD-dependent oxidoreductase [Sandaracinus sp.]
MSTSDRTDVLIVGGGPAGLGAALTFARAGKSAIVCDAGAPRNTRATVMHGYPGADGIPPAELRARARAELAHYPSISFREARVAGIDRVGGELVASLGKAGEVRARRVLLATGIVDGLPKLEGFADAWGRSVFDCPYCHGYEHRGEAWGFVAPKVAGIRTVLSYLAWTRDMIVFTDGFTLDLPADIRRELEHAKVRLEPRKMVRLVVEGDALQGVEVEGGEVVARRALVYHPQARPSDLALMLGLAQDGGFVKIDPRTRETSLRGVHACGDLVANGMKALLAAADGMHAAQMLTEQLTLEDVLGAR